MMCRTLFASLVTFLALPQSQYAWAQTSQGPILINVGGPTYVDSMGNVWDNDEQFVVNAGELFRDDSPIAGTSDEALYQSQRVGRSQDPPLEYEIPVHGAAGSLFDVYFHFSEMNPEAMAVGARVFDVIIEGNVAIKSLDVYGQVGHHTALTKVATATVYDGLLSIHFVDQGAMVSAIEIIPLASSTSRRKLQEASLPVYINAGGNEFTDVTGRTWMKDTYYNNGGAPENKFPPLKDIQYTDNDELYQSARYNLPATEDLAYNIPLPNGKYDVSLHFSEVYNRAMYNGAREFSVMIEGSPAFDKVDIFKEVGAYAPLIKKATVTVSDGTLSIRFGQITENAKISAIEIREAFTAASSPTTSDNDAIYRINAGSGSYYVDKSGSRWSADEYYNNGGEIENWSEGSRGILKTNDDELYRSARYDPPSEPELVYNLPVENADYVVILHFAETWRGIKDAGQRVFDVFVEGEKVLSEFDIFAEGGGSFTAVKKSATATVSDGMLTISFGKIEENAKICAIEVYSADSSSLPILNGGPTALETAPLYINVGGDQIIGPSGIIWKKDEYFTGGLIERLFFAGVRNIFGTNNDMLYQTARYDPGEGIPLRYDIPIANGNYTVTMHWTDVYIPTQRIGARVFDVILQGSTAAQNLDIFKESGANAALKKSFSATVTNELISIEFAHVTENPKLCAVEIQAGKPPIQSGPPQDIFPLYINAGGKALTDSTGISWIEDSYFNDGGTVENIKVSPTIVGAADSSIYWTGRYDPKSSKSPASLRYDIPCSNGQYSILFHFSELYSGAFSNGARVFSIKVENTLALEDIDIYKESGGSYAALIKTVSTTVADGMLSFEFVHGSENPKVSAIEVHKGILATGPTPSGPPPLPSEPPPGPSSGQSIYINAGGGTFTDSKGINWVSDRYFNTGKHEPFAGAAIAGTQDEGLFRTGRYDVGDDIPLEYSIPVESNGSYDVTLLWAETYSKAMATGSRVFDVSINGMKKFPNIDIFGETKAGNRVLKKTATVSVTNKTVMILFGHVNENPKINAIQVTPSSSSVPPTDPPSPNASPSPQITGGALELPVRINSGGEAYIDSSGDQWAADSFYNDGGETEQVWTPVTTIYGTADDVLYTTARYSPEPKPPLKYEIPVPNGKELEVTFHFAEVYNRAMYKLARVFSVKVEQETVLSNLDIYAEVGGYTALKKTVTTTVNDDNLSIEFDHIEENPKISAIEIHEKDTTTIINSELAPPPITSRYMLNIGSNTAFTDSSGRTWQADKFFEGGKEETIPHAIPGISGTLDDELYKTARYDPDDGPGLKYEFPVTDGDYKVTLHFSENWKGNFEEGAREFDVLLEGSAVLEDLDIFKEAGEFAALTKTEYASVNDGFLTLQFAHKTENPKLSALEIEAAVIPTGRVSHRAHAVPGGPYVQTDVDGNGFETIKVDGTFSHTHTAGSDVASFVWKVDGSEVGNGMITNITLPVGFHTLTLDVVDSDGDFSSDYTTVNIKPQGFPDISSLSPPGGDITGGEKVIITGSGFASSAEKTTVHFGSTKLTGPSQITVINESTIEVKQTPVGIMGPALVTVDTEVGPSNKAYYAYSDSTLPPVNFKFGVATKDIYGPTTVAFGPDGKLYIGTQAGLIIKATLDEDYKVIESEKIISDVVAESTSAFRSILGITFDPMDVSSNPTLYVAHCSLFHGQVVSYNGKVSAVTGENLDQMEHIVTGLPVSDHDHGINGMEFGDNGDLYIQIGGNTNAGVPGAVSSTGLQEEGELSAATIVAHVSRPLFNGNVQYNDDGDIVSGDDVEVFASGQRNAFDLVLHSNGYLYGTDNGPNNKYGEKSVDCDSAAIDPHEDDELNLLEKDKYYGHANRKRGEKDPRQCKWRSATEKSDDEYTAPMHMLPASCNGIAEFQTRHFGGQLRGHLLIGRYKGALYQVTLSNDGRSVVGQHQMLKKAGGLDVTQGPDGTLFVAQNTNGQVISHSPTEPSLGKLHVTSVFPRRGPTLGGSTLTLYGEEFGSNSTVTVGGNNCAVQSNNGNKMTCQIPSGSGKADIVVSSEGQTDTFTEGYRFITGSTVLLL